MTSKHSQHGRSSKASHQEDGTASLISTSLSQLTEHPWHSIPVLPSLASSFESYTALFDAFLAHKKTSMTPSDYSFFIKTTGGITRYPLAPSNPKSNASDSITLGDKIAALSLAVSEAPLYALPYLHQLLHISASEKRREAGQGLEALVELFHNVPLICSDDVTHSSPLIAQFDRDIKSIYTSTLRLLEVHAHDQLEHGRHTACRLLSRLLLSPRITVYKQSNVVAILVNKMGDPDRKLASRIAYYLEQAWISKGIDSTADVEMAITRSMSVILKHGQKKGKKPRHKKKDAQEEGSEKAAYRVIYYAMTLLTQLKLQRNSPITMRVINIYGLLFEHFVIAPHSDTPKAEKGKKDKKGKKKKQDPSQHSHEFGRIAKLLLTGLSRAIPFASDQTGNDHLRKIIQPLTALSKTTDNLALVWQSLGLLGMLGEDILPELTGRLSRSSELIKYRGTHLMLLNLIEKYIHSNYSTDQTIAILKKLLGLRCIGVLHADPLPMVKRLMDKHRELSSALRLPDDQVQVQSQCLWELTFLAKHFKASQRLNAAMVLNGRTLVKGIDVGVMEEMVDVEWLTAWTELKYDVHADLEYLMTEYKVHEGTQKGKKTSALNKAADKIVRDEMERMAGVDEDDDMGGDEGMSFDDDSGDAMSEEELGSVTGSDNEEEEGEGALEGRGRNPSLHPPQMMTMMTMMTKWSRHHFVPRGKRNKDDVEE